jgi:Ca2+-binding RTX toxin-like protein
MSRKPLNFPQSLRKTSLALAIAATLTLPIAALAAPGDPVGGEFRVNTTIAGDQRNSDVATDADGDYVVVWESPDGGGSSARFGNFGDSGIFAQRYNNAGVRQGGEFRVNTTIADSQSRPSVALDADGDFVITWQSYLQDGSVFGVYAQRYNRTGVAQGGEFRANTFTSGTQSNPTVSLDADGDFVVVWDGFRGDYVGENAYLGIYARRFDRAGTPQGGEFRVSTDNDTQQIREFPVVALDADGDFVVAWKDVYCCASALSADIVVQRFNSAGVPQSGNFVVNGSVSASQVVAPDVAIDTDGDFVVTWQTNPYFYNDPKVFARRYNNLGIPQGDAFQVAASATNNESFPSVALDADGDFVVAFRSEGSLYNIFAQRYNNEGVPQGSEFQVNTTGLSRFSQDGNPAVALDADGDFVVTWDGNGPGDDSGIFGRRFMGGGSSSAVTCGGRTATVVGTSGNDTLTGTAGSDVIAGLDGNDIILGLGGNDTLCGNAGNDRLLGGFDNDLLIGGPGIDNAEFGGTAGVAVNLASGTATGQGSDRLFTIENVKGTDAADNLTGNEGRNTLIGTGGNDILNGAGGNDYLFGGTANDTLNGGAGFDICDGQTGSADTAGNCEVVQDVP